MPKSKPNSHGLPVETPDSESANLPKATNDAAPAECQQGISRDVLYPIHKVLPGGVETADDCVAVEEPMEIRLVYGPDSHRKMRAVSVTMRTPGHDRELAAGFLFTENLLESPAQIRQIRSSGVSSEGKPTGNIVRVELQPEIDPDLGKIQRNFYTTSSCGVCGKSSLDALAFQGVAPLADSTFSISVERIKNLPLALRSRQPTFASTGGLHAAAMFDERGRIEEVREDVGRHNAVDKLVGNYFMAGQAPLSDFGMIISGRASFEIMQKAIVAGVSLVVAVGAPSSLAVDLARQYHVTLVGFASESRFNIYSLTSRIDGVQGPH